VPTPDDRVLRLVATLLGVGFVIQGIGFLVAPARAAGGLGMPFLNDVGRSTQIGDFAAFFLMAGTTMVLGSRPGRGALLFVPAGMLGCAAAGRTIAWLVHGAAFAGVFIAVEVLGALVLATAARRGG